MEPDTVLIDYTNYLGKRSIRLITPLKIEFTLTQYHPERQWILHATDRNKNEVRSFAMKDIHSWSGKFTQTEVDPDSWK